MEIMHEIKEWQPTVTYDDHVGYSDAGVGLTIFSWVTQLQRLAVPILSNYIVTRLNKISFNIDDINATTEADAELRALVPAIEDELASISPSDLPPPNPDLPDNITKDYKEAGTIVELSPRGAAALLRLCIQNLCIHLGKPGENLYDDIGALVEDGLDERIQQALDTVRVLGNEAVHPGVLDLKDDRQTVKKLFGFVNEIAQEMITRPREKAELYNMLPENKRKGIDDRDKKMKAATSGAHRAD